jgi:hypothetical protein
MDELGVLVHPLLPADSAGMVVLMGLRPEWHGARILNPENVGGFLAVLARGDTDPPIPMQTLASRLVHEAVNQRIWKAGQAVAPLNAPLGGPIT